MQTYFKTMLNKSNLGLNPMSSEGTGLFLDTRPSFYKAIMRRLGFDQTKKINYQEFAKLLKPSQPENVIRAFGQQLDQNRVNEIMRVQGELAKSIRDAEKGFYPLGPLLSFKHTGVRSNPRPNPNSDLKPASYLQSSQKKTILSKLPTPREHSAISYSRLNENSEKSVQRRRSSLRGTGVDTRLAQCPDYSPVKTNESESAQATYCMSNVAKSAPIATEIIVRRGSGCRSDLSKPKQLSVTSNHKELSVISPKSNGTTKSVRKYELVDSEGGRYHDGGTVEKE